MERSHEFESLEAFLASQVPGYAILYQRPAPHADDQEPANERRVKLEENFHRVLKETSPILGRPDELASTWDLGIPTFASGTGYALWNGTDSFTSLFISSDNPEDPSFVIIGRAPRDSFNPEPGAPDPWGQQWMEKGEWGNPN